MNEELIGRLAEGGHTEVRLPHGNVFQYLDDEGTRVGVLAERAHMTKQAMAQLVAHLEEHGYVERIPDPADRRAKLVRTTARGRDVFAIVRAFVAERRRPARPRAGRRERTAAARAAGGSRRALAASRPGASRAARSPAAT